MKEKGNANFAKIPITTKKGKASIGGSKLGGYPDFPAGLKWPEKLVPEKDEKGPLAFICQINLSEFKNDFASKGILYFFTVPAPDDLGNKHVVIFYDGNEPLSSRKVDMTWLEGLVDAELPLPEYKLILGKKDAKGNSCLFGKGDYIQENMENKSGRMLLL